MAKSPLWDGDPGIGAGEYYGGGGYHGAWDVNLTNKSPLYAVKGVIVAAEYSNPNGGSNNYVVLGVMVNDPDSKKEKKASISYCHMFPLGDSKKDQEIKRRLRPGTLVETGDQIGWTGLTGNTSGPHLHVGCQWGWTSEVFAHQNRNGTIFPPSDVWKNFSDNVTGNPPGGEEVDGDSVGDANEASLRHEGNFQRVLEALNVEEMRKSEFNPPLPSNFASGFTSGYAGSSDVRQEVLSMYRGNARGWIVRDPLFMGEPTAADEPEESDENKRKDNSDPDNGGADSVSTGEEAGKWLAFSKKYGFRFLYNPTTYGESYQSVADVDPIRFSQSVSQGVQAIVGAAGGNIGFELLLYRRFDVEFIRSLVVRGRSFEEAAKIINDRGYYPEQVTGATVRRLMEEGTRYDLEYLFRVTNGDPQDTWHGESSDWGLMIPTMVVVSLGDGPTSRRVRGLLSGINVTHEFFSSGMVPTITRVGINLTRIADSYYTSSGDMSPSPSGDSTTSLDEEKKKKKKKKDEEKDDNGLNSSNQHYAPNATDLNSSNQHYANQGVTTPSQGSRYPVQVPTSTGKTGIDRQRDRGGSR